MYFIVDCENALDEREREYNKKKTNMVYMGVYIWIE